MAFTDDLGHSWVSDGVHDPNCTQCPTAVVADDYDDIDHADVLLEQARNSVEYEQGSAYAKLAAAHIQLWYAKECRAYRDATQAQRRMFQQAQQAAPPPPPPMPAWPLPVPNGF